MAFQTLPAEQAEVSPTCTAGMHCTSTAGMQVGDTSACSAAAAVLAAILPGAAQLGTTGTGGTAERCRVCRAWCTCRPGQCHNVHRMLRAAVNSVQVLATGQLLVTVFTLLIGTQRLVTHTAQIPTHILRTVTYCCLEARAPSMLLGAQLPQRLCCWVGYSTFKAESRL